MDLIRREYSDNPLTDAQVDKIGNALIFLSGKITPLYKTKALKLLYIIEELSIRKFGVPFFGVDFQLWSLGPVVRDVYIYLTSPAETSLFDKYIEVLPGTESTAINSRTAFCNDEFSDCDIEVLNIVTEKYHDKTGKELISLTHREDFPWNITAKEHGILEELESGKRLSTNIIIDMSSLLNDAPQKKEFYLNTLEFHKQSNLLKGYK